MTRFIRESPATAFFLALWVAVFAAMMYVQGGLHAGGDVVTGGILPETGKLFGSQTSRQLYGGQLWRALSATWIHYSLIHLLGNMWVMYQIGPLVERWYGSGLFLGLCVGLGWVGNLIAGLSKPFIAGALRRVVTVPDYASGGASGLICGLIALVAVVGWRSRTRFGDFIRGQMLGFLGYVAIMGLVLPSIDNFGHAGGAAAGALAGFLHRPMMRLARTRAALLAGAAGLAALAGCGWLQYAWAHSAPPAALPTGSVKRLPRGLIGWGLISSIDGLYRTLASGPSTEAPALGMPPAPPRSHLIAALQQTMGQLTPAELSLETPAEAKAFEVTRSRILALEDRRPSPTEIVQFQRDLDILKRRAFTTMLATRPPESGPPPAVSPAPLIDRSGGQGRSR